MGRKTKETKKNNKQVKAVTQMLASTHIAQQANNLARKAEKRAMKRAVAKQMKKVARTKGNQLIAHAGLAGVEGMDYLKCLLNPEQFKSGYPDKYNDKTTVATFIYNRNLQWDSDGNFFVWVNPTMVDHIVQLTNGIPAATYQFQGVFTGAVQVDTTGTVVKLPNVESKEILSAVGNNEAFALMQSASGDFAWPTMTATGQWYLNWTDTNISWDYSIDGGVTYSAVTTGTAINVAVGVGKIRFRAKATNAGTTSLVSKVTISASLPLSGSAPAGSPVYTADDVDYYNTLSGINSQGRATDDGPLYNEYRVVGMSTLITYEGDTLYNGGNIAGRVVPGGETPIDLGWVDYQSIASFPDSYERPLTMGSYGFWLPTDDKDMVFRKLDQSNFVGDSVGDLPSLVFAGTVKNTDNAILRLRVAMVIEAKSTPSFISTDYSPVDTRQIDAVAVALRGIPRIMENPLHLADIKNFLKSVFNKGKKYYDTAKTVYNAVEPFAVPLMNAAAALML